MIILIFTLSAATALFAVQWHLSVLALLASCGAYYAGHLQGKEWERLSHVSNYACVKYDDVLKEREEWHGY